MEERVLALQSAIDGADLSPSRMEQVHREQMRRAGVRPMSHAEREAMRYARQVESAGLSNVVLEGFAASRRHYGLAAMSSELSAHHRAFGMAAIFASHPMRELIVTRDIYARIVDGYNNSVVMATQRRIEA